MAIGKTSKSFLKAVEESLTKDPEKVERFVVQSPIPPQRLEVNPKLLKEIDPKGIPSGAVFDIGEEHLKEPTTTDKVVEGAENIEGKMSDMAFITSVLNTGKDILKIPIKAANALAKTSNALGNYAEPLQAALWGADAIRSITDKDYLQKETDQQAERLDKGDLAGIISASIQRPTSGLAGLTDATGNAIQKEKDAKEPL